MDKHGSKNSPIIRIEYGSGHGQSIGDVWPYCGYDEHQSINGD